MTVPLQQSPPTIKILLNGEANETRNSISISKFALQTFCYQLFSLQHWNLETVIFLQAVSFIKLHSGSKKTEGIFNLGFGQCNMNFRVDKVDKGDWKVKRGCLMRIYGFMEIKVKIFLFYTFGSVSLGKTKSFYICR